MPGSHSVLVALHPLARVSASWMVWSSAWPMCRRAGHVRRRDDDRERRLVARRVGREVPLLSLFAVDEQAGLRPLFAGGRDDEAGLVATRIAPGSTLLPVDPKVSGGMTIEAKNAGELVVHTDFVFAYAFATDDVEKLRGPMDIVAVTRVQYDYIMRSGPSFRPESQGMWSGPSTGHSYSIDCTASQEGFLAPSFREQQAKRGSTRENGSPEDYFDPSKPMPTINHARPRR
jgi:hypothetical protein